MILLSESNFLLSEPLDKHTYMCSTDKKYIPLRYYSFLDVKNR
jgi:hypothetical protein